MLKPGIIYLLVHIYHYLLCLYPADFLDEFGQEMESVFSRAIREARAESFRLVAVIFLRELRDYPLSLWREQRRSRRKRKAVDDTRTIAISDAVEGPDDWPPATGLEKAATILPFALFGLLYTLKAIDYASGYRHIPFHWNQLLFLILLAGLGIGWIRGFPRWSLGYLGMVLIISLLDWQSWIPFLVVLIVATLLSRSFTPLVKLARDIWRDWSRLSFIFYSVLTWLALGVAYDGKTFDSQIAYLPLKIFGAALFYLMGALFYLRVQTAWRRALVLQAAFSLALLSGVLISWLVDGRVTMATPDSLSWWLVVILLLFGSMFLPGALGIIRRTNQRLHLT